MKIRKISRRRPRSVDYAELGHFTLLFCRLDGKEMYKDLQRTCIATVLLIKPFAWWRFRCFLRRGLLKLHDNSIERRSDTIRLVLLFYIITSLLTAVFFVVFLVLST